MTKRKYTRGNEEVKGYECCNKKCKWQGTEDQKAKRKDEDWTTDVCPNCGKDEFYGLREFNQEKEIAS